MKTIVIRKQPLGKKLNLIIEFLNNNKVKNKICDDLIFVKIDGFEFKAYLDSIDVHFGEIDNYDF